MRKVCVKAKMTEMIRWTLKRALQMPFWNFKVMWMAQLLLVTSQGGYALPFIGHHRLLKHRFVESEFDNADNPGQWSEFTFRPVFAKGGGI